VRLSPFTSSILPSVCDRGSLVAACSAACRVTGSIRITQSFARCLCGARAAYGPFASQKSARTDISIGAKKSPYRKDTGVPELLLPRCANGKGETGTTGQGSRDLPAIAQTRGNPAETFLPVTARTLRTRRFRSRADIAGYIATQIAARRRWREVMRAFVLLPRLERGRPIRPPVPSLWSLLCESRCGN
jgi:hypothetical protein